jgi:hypothetical protein
MKTLSIIQYNSIIIELIIIIHKEEIGKIILGIYNSMCVILFIIVFLLKI